MGRRKNLYLLVLFLAAAHLLYAPAWRAGWVRDVTGWIESLHTQTPTEYLLRRGWYVESLYPFTQGMLWVWWKLFGIHPLPWHLMMVSLHAGCAWGWALFYGKVLEARNTGIFAGLFFLLSPYATEVVVWEAGYHYLQGMALMLVSLFALLRYLEGGKMRWLTVGLIAFLPTLFALEVFYLTPVYAALLVFYYRKNPRSPKAFRAFVLPMLGLWVVQYGLFRLLYHQTIPHIKTLTVWRMSDYLRKPGKYFFHLFLFGRYWPVSLRLILYDVFNSWAFLITIYASLLILIFQKRQALHTFVRRPAFLPVAFAVTALLLVAPLYFQEGGLVDFDRYAYFMLPAVGAIVGIYFRKTEVRAAVWVLSAALLFYTNWLWRQSDALNRDLLLKIPAFKDGKPSLLLNLPSALQNIPMVGQTAEGEAALMRRLVLQRPLPGTVLEPSAAALSLVGDLAVETQWLSAQTLQVTQIRGGGWWTEGVLSADWENDAFSIRFFPEKRAYVLTLKGPAQAFHLLQWKGSGWVEIGANESRQ